MSRESNSSVTMNSGALIVECNLQSPLNLISPRTLAVHHLGDIIPKVFKDGRMSTSPLWSHPKSILQPADSSCVSAF